VLARCAQVGVDLTDDEYQLIQVWFGASQWASNGGEQRAEAPATQEAPRRYGQPDLGLPSPNAQPSIPMPSDFGMPESERQNDPPAQSGSLRYSFLKHG
jgi:hypothetical protein